VSIERARWRQKQTNKQNKTKLFFQVLPSGDLYIHDLSFEDMGMFRCMVSNEFGHDMKETFVYPLAVSPEGSFLNSFLAKCGKSSRLRQNWRLVCVGA
jgi:hypothetical protein